MKKSKKEGRPNGYIQRVGPTWYLTYSQNALGAKNEIVRTRRKQRLGTTSQLSEEDARRAADEFLADLNPRVVPAMTLQEFADRIYRPLHIEFLKDSGQRHLGYLLKKHILPAWGSRRLTSIMHDDVQELISLKAKTAFKIGKSDRKQGYSSKTCQLLRSAISGLFACAIRKNAYFKQNPAIGVRLPESCRVFPKRALTFEQGSALVQALPSPAKEMVLIGMTTSMGRAELLGLRWGRVNLTEKSIIADGDNLPPHCLAIRENFYFGTVKTASRDRLVALPKVVVEALQGIKIQSEWTEEQDLVFVNPQQRGVPLNCRNLERRVLKPIAATLGIGFFSWHTARRTFSSLTSQLSSWSVADRMFSMGHSSAMMTQHYAVSDLQRRRVGVEDMARLLAPPASPTAENVPEGQVTTKLEGQAPEGPSDPASAPNQHQEGPLENVAEEGGIK
jgi:integrase